MRTRSLTEALEEFNSGRQTPKRLSLAGNAAATTRNAQRTPTAGLTQVWQLPSPSWIAAHTVA